LVFARTRRTSPKEDALRELVTIDVSNPPATAIRGGKVSVFDTVGQ
jgi:hypothetical protein